MSEITPFSKPLFDDFPSPDLPHLTDNFPTDKQPEMTDGEKFVVFFLGDEFFAVQASRVAEIVRPLDFTPLPNSPDWLHGIANLRGEIVSVLNLSKICGKAGAADSSKSKLVILKTRAAASTIAFPVDRLSEIVTFAVEHIQPAEDARYLGCAVYKTATVNLLDTEKLFASLI
jgi:purine-binding chemotaxis protein CheW